MKPMKKIVCCLLAILMTAMLLPLSVSAQTSPVLRFNEDGTFKIMMFADSQDDENLEETTLQLMREALDTYQPDLVVYLGDNTVASGYDNQHAAIEALTEPCVSRGVPFAIVFGNHDQEQGVEKEDLLAMYREFGCLTYDADPDLYGCGTCNLPIFASSGLKIAFNLWLTDSGSRNPDKEVGGYDYVREDQIEWYKNTAATLKALNGGETVPAINFQHIVVPEVYDAMGYPKLPVAVGDVTTYLGNTYIPVPKFSSHTGITLEPPCPPYVTAGQFDAWVETGDIVASFFGHDHVNSYTTNYKGIDLTSVPTVGCNSYSNEINRGVGLITLNENDPQNYSYELIHMYDMALAEGSEIPNADGAKSTVYYRFMQLVDKLLKAIHSIFLAMPVIK